MSVYPPLPSIKASAVSAAELGSTHSDQTSLHPSVPCCFPNGHEEECKSLAEFFTFGVKNLRRYQSKARPKYCDTVMPHPSPTM